MDKYGIIETGKNRNPLWALKYNPSKCEVKKS